MDQSASRNPEEFRINGGLLIRILLVIARGETGRKDLQLATGLSQGTITRMLHVARAQFGVDIQFDRSHGYQVQDWGVFNPEVFQEVLQDNQEG